jgi:hypothetical protein
MTGADDRHGATEDPDEPRRRFRRRLDRIDAVAGDPEALAAVHAELVLLREENARLKAAQHQRVDISRLLGRARSLSSSEGDRDNVGDDTEQLLVEGLVIRESLLEICQEIERAMVAFEAKLSALASVGAVRPEPRPIHDDETVNGHGARTA